MEGREIKKGVSTESLNILSVYVKTCVVCMWERLVAARPCGSMDIAIDKAGVTRRVCLGVSVSISLGLWAGDLCGPSLSLCYVNLPKPSKASWTTKRRLRIDQDTHTHTQIHFLNQCV